MAKQMTMKDIAKLAGVSQPTVSRVINGNKEVNEELAKRVMKVIEQVGFVPNKTARSLKQSHSKLIGISVSEMYNPYFVELIDHIETITRKHGYNIILHNAKHNPILEWENIQNFMMRQVDGCIIVPEGQYNLERIKQLSIPVIAITQTIEGMDSVALNHKKAGSLAAQCFLRQGHSSFGYIGTKDDDKFIGYESELYENGYTFNHEHFIEIDHATSNPLSIRKHIEAYISKQGSLPFSCVFTENDIIALELKRLTESYEIIIPQQLSMVGFDDTYFSKLLGISSIQQPIEEMVNLSIELLINRIEGKASSEHVSIQLEPALIERQSTRVI